jgi:hypothetical protein
VSLSVNGDNVIRGNATREVALRGSGNTLVDNRISAYLDDALSVQEGADFNDIPSNIFTGPVRIVSSRNWLNGSTVEQGVIVEGERNRIEDNLVTGYACGLEFLVDGANEYRDNVITGTLEGVCGLPNLDKRGNVFVPPTP